MKEYRFISELSRTRVLRRKPWSVLLKPIALAGKVLRGYYGYCPVTLGIVCSTWRLWCCLRDSGFAGNVSDARVIGSWRFIWRFQWKTWQNQSMYKQMLTG